MCVTVPCVRSFAIYMWHYDSITVTVKYLWDHHHLLVCIVLNMVFRWNWNDSHMYLASGFEIGHFESDQNSSEKIMWRGKDLILTG